MLFAVYIHMDCVLCKIKFQGFPLLSKSAQPMFTHANARLENFLDALNVILLLFRVLAIALAFGVLAKLA